MGCFSGKSSYESQIDEFFFEMPIISKGSIDAIQAINSSLPSTGKYASMSPEDFESKLNTVILTSNVEIYKQETHQFWYDVFKTNFTGNDAFPLFYLYMAMLGLTKDLTE